jgi:hypothetical protein
MARSVSGVITLEGNWDTEDAEDAFSIDEFDRQIRQLVNDALPVDMIKNGVDYTLAFKRAEEEDELQEVDTRRHGLRLLSLVRW